MELTMATTLGDLFPALKDCRPKPEKKQKPTRKGTAQKLKELYPEMESWNCVFITKAWFHWLRAEGQALAEPETRDERFPEFLVEKIRETMVESGTWR